MASYLTQNGTGGSVQSPEGLTDLTSFRHVASAGAQLHHQVGLSELKGACQVIISKWWTWLNQAEGQDEDTFRRRREPAEGLPA